MILETCDLWDIWSDRFLEDFQIFGRFSDFWKIFRILEDFQNFGRFLDFWKIFRFLDNPRTCDIWDTDYNSDNWEPEFMTIFVIWQLIVTLDSIRNSCDVWNYNLGWEAGSEIESFFLSRFRHGFEIDKYNVHWSLLWYLDLCLAKPFLDLHDFPQRSHGMEIPVMWFASMWSLIWFLSTHYIFLLFLGLCKDQHCHWILSLASNI